MVQTLPEFGGKSIPGSIKYLKDYLTYFGVIETVVIKEAWEKSDELSLLIVRHYSFVYA